MNTAVAPTATNSTTGTTVTLSRCGTNTTGETLDWSYPIGIDVDGYDFR